MSRPGMSIPETLFFILLAFTAIMLLAIGWPILFVPQRGTGWPTRP